MIELAAGTGVPYAPIAFSQVALEELTGDRVYVRPLPTVAGTNRLLQLLADNPGWVEAAKWIAGVYGADFLLSATKKGWRERAKLAKTLVDLANTPVGRLIGYLRQEGAGVGSLAIPTRAAARNAAITVAGLSPGEVASLIANLSQRAEKISAFLRDAEKQGFSLVQLEQGFDNAVTIIPLDDGALAIRGRRRSAPSDEWEEFEERFE